MMEPSDNKIKGSSLLIEDTISASATVVPIVQYEELKQQIEQCMLDRTQVAQVGAGFDRLVFEGGGVRGIAFGGVLRFMEEYGLIKNVTSVAGSSAGAIFAAALSVGYTSQEIIDELKGLDFETFKDDSWGVVLDIIRLMTQYGIYKGDAFYKWFAGLLHQKTGDANITFRQVYERYGIRLVITGTCLNKATTYYFHHEDPKYADMSVALAVRISMSIPLFWKAVKLGTDVMVDGGVLNNYPIYVFDGPTIGETNVTDEEIAKSTTLGFKLMTSMEKADNELYYVDQPISGPVDYAKAFLNATLIQIERAHIRKGYWQRTVCINTHDISSLDFGIGNDKKTALIHEGYIATKNFFNCLITGVPNEMNRSIHR